MNFPDERLPRNRYRLVENAPLKGNINDMVPLPPRLMAPNILKIGLLLITFVKSQPYTGSVSFIRFLL